MQRLTKQAVIFALAAALTAPSLAFADTSGAKGTIASLEVNTTSSDRYLQHHGRIIVVSGGKNTTASAEYRWGGVACGSRTLSEQQVALLQRALESGTPITPLYQDGQGATLCLVGVTLAP